MKTIARYLAAFLALALLVGCGGEEKQKSQNFEFCRSNEDCPHGASCENGFCTCSTSNDCLGENYCYGGYCCQGIGSADSPCTGAGYMSQGPPTYAIPGLYCAPSADTVMYYEEQTYPCMYGATCHAEQRQVCAAGFACRNLEPGEAECALWEGKAACAQVQNGFEPRPCETPGLRICRALYTEQGDAQCMVSECQAEAWALFQVVSCAKLSAEDCDCAFDLGFAGARPDGDMDAHFDCATGASAKAGTRCSRKDTQLCFCSDFDGVCQMLLCTNGYWQDVGMNMGYTGGDGFGACTCLYHTDADGDSDTEAETAKCTSSTDCEEGVSCYSGYCCKWINSSDYPCYADPLAQRAGCDHGGLCCYQGNVTRFVTHMETGPCESGGTCSITVVEKCPLGTSCIASQGTIPACTIIDGDAEGDTEN